MVKATLVNPSGSGGGHPIYRFTGPKNKLTQMLHKSKYVDPDADPFECAKYLERYGRLANPDFSKDWQIDLDLDLVDGQDGVNELLRCCE